MHADKKPVVLQSSRNGRLVESGWDSVDLALEAAVTDYAFGHGGTPILIMEHGRLVMTREQIEAAAAKRDRGYTLIEVLVGITILVIMAAMLSCVGVGIHYYANNVASTAATE